MENATNNNNSHATYKTWSPVSNWLGISIYNNFQIYIFFYTSIFYADDNQSGDLDYKILFFLKYIGQLTPKAIQKIKEKKLQWV